MLEVHVTFPDGFPIRSPPKVIIYTNTYHPGVEGNGEFCRDVYQDKFEAGVKLFEVWEWCAESLNKIPQPAAARRHELAEEYVNNNAEFLKKLRLGASNAKLSF